MTESWLDRDQWRLIYNTVPAELTGMLHFMNGSRISRVKKYYPPTSIVLVQECHALNPIRIPLRIIYQEVKIMLKV